MPRTKRLNQEMTRFLQDSGYGDPNEVVVLTDGARDLAGVANDLPYLNEWILDWAHIGRMLLRVDQAITPLAYGRLTESGFCLRTMGCVCPFVRSRHYVWTGSKVVWQQFATELAHLLNFRENRDPAVSRQVKKAIYSLSDAVTYLKSNVESLIDYRTWQRAGGRISAGFVESSINRIVGRQMCKSQHIRWSRVGAHSVVQVRVARLNQNLTNSLGNNIHGLSNDLLRGPGRKHPRGFNGFQHKCGNQHSAVCGRRYARAGPFCRL